MTSFVVEAHVKRQLHQDWDDKSQCTFCRIIANELPATRVYEDEKILAFLDILPLRPGHTLVIPKIHISRVSELPAEFSAALGGAVSKVARALSEALGNTALNIVCNQEYAQSIPHVHYHIIPAPSFGSSAAPVHTRSKTSNSKLPTSQRELHQREYEAREELDECDGKELATKIRARL